MCHRRGLTLVELLIVAAVIALLVGILAPSINRAKERARIAVCQRQMSIVHQGIATYAAVYSRKFPPFAFSDLNGNLPASGHWGGTKAMQFGRIGIRYVNHSVLLLEQRIPDGCLVCPSADKALKDGKASYFPQTMQFSTHCWRFPYSRDVFGPSAPLADHGGTLLGVYRAAAGGQTVSVGADKCTVPQLKLGFKYRADAAVTCGDGRFDTVCDVVMADPFWMRQAIGPDGTYRTQAGWCHGEEFNVCRGDGSTSLVVDDGTISDNTPGGTATISDDGMHYAGYAERVWQFLDEQSR